jgi:hypothetical protein
VASVLILFFGLAALLATQMPIFDGAAPFFVGAIGALLSLAILVVFLFKPQPGNGPEPFSHVGLFAIFLLATPLTGLFVSSFAFVGAVLWRSGVRPGRSVTAAAVFVALQFAILALVFDVAIEKEIVGRVAWALMF